MTRKRKNGSETKITWTGGQAARRSDKEISTISNKYSIYCLIENIFSHV